MPFTNRIRLPFQLVRPQWPETKQVYKKSNGDIVTISSVISKKYEGETDSMPAKWHERLVIALGHDNVNVESDQYVGAISKNGDYGVDWVKFLDYPTAKGAFEVNATPFDGTNSNCMTCEQAGQLDAVNDSFPDPLEEDTTYEIQVEANDKICCFPFEFSITSYDSTYLSSATIDSTGKLTVHTKTGLTDANGLALVVYRVTCTDDGSYDEATVSADIDGTVAAPCLAPLAVSIDDITSTTATVNFTPPTPAPDHYFWKLYIGASLVDSADAAGSPINLTGLDPGEEDYKFFIRGQCDGTDDDGTASNFVEIDFATSTASGLCGQYSLSYNCPPCPNAGMGGHINVSYYDCNGNLATVYVPNNIHRAICALQTAPGAPVGINGGGDPNFSYSYDTLCP